MNILIIIFVLLIVIIHTCQKNMFTGATSFHQDISEWPQEARDSCTDGVICVTALQAFNNLDELKEEVTKYCNDPDSINVGKYGYVTSHVKSIMMGFSAQYFSSQQYDTTVLHNLIHLHHYFKQSNK